MVFSQVIEQKLEPGDRLLLCNHAIVRTLGDEHIGSLLHNDADATQVLPGSRGEYTARTRRRTPLRCCSTSSLKERLNQG